MPDPYAAPAQDMVPVGGEPGSLARLMRLQGAMVIAFSLLVGAVITMQVATGLTKFGGLEYVPRVILLSVVRALGSALSAAAALFALLVWTHRVDASAIRPNLLQAAPSVLLASLVATPVAVGLAVAAGFLTAHSIYDVPWRTIAASRRVLTVGDIPAAGYVLLKGLVVNGAFCWFALPFMSRRSWSLLQKLGAVWAVLFALRMLIQLFVAPSSEPAGV